VKNGLGIHQVFAHDFCLDHKSWETQARFHSQFASRSTEPQSAGSSSHVVSAGPRANGDRTGARRVEDSRPTTRRLARSELKWPVRSWMPHLNESAAVRNGLSCYVE
jgi:hypothetical protein